MQQRPPPPPGFRPVTAAAPASAPTPMLSASRPPPPPGFRPVGQQAQSPARAAPSQARPAPSRPQPMQQAPAPSYGAPQALGREERIGALLDQGFSPDVVERMADEQMAYEGFQAPPPQSYAPASGAPGQSRESPINLAAETLYQNEFEALKKGAWVRDRTGAVFQLPGDAYTAQPDDSAERQSRNIYLDRPDFSDKVDAFSQAAGEQIPGLDEAAAAVSGITTGRGFDAMRDQQILSRLLQNQTDRGARVAGGLTGFATSMAIPGGSFIARGGNVANRALRGVGVGVTTGTVYGAGAAEGGLGERAIGAGQGALFGGLTGGAVPIAGAATGATGRLIRRTMGRMVDATLERPQNPQVAQREAISALQRALQGDGVNAATAGRITNEWMQTGVTPNLVDLVPRGGQTQRLFRGAAMRSGPAATSAEGYMDTVAGQIQDNAISLTRRLTPEQRTADEIVESLKQGRSAQAETDYLGPYRAQVPVDESLLSALSDDPGRAALRRARAAAVSRRNPEQVAEIDALLSDTPPTAVSAATADRARIAMAGRGRNLMTGSSARPDVAGGLFGRADDIDAALAGVTDIQPARETYRRFSDGIGGVEIGQSIRSADPDQLAARLNGREGARFTAPVGAARSLETAIGTPTEGATGLLNRIATSSNMKRNLGTIFGQAGGARYQEGVGNLTSQLNNARFMASSTGSQSIGRAADMVDPIQIPQGPIAALMMAIDKIRRGVQLTEAESEVLVRLGQQPATRGLFGGSRNRAVSGYAVPTTAALLGTLPAR